MNELEFREIQIPKKLYDLLEKYAEQHGETTEKFTTNILMDAVGLMLRGQAIEVGKQAKDLLNDLHEALSNQTTEPDDYSDYIDFNESSGTGEYIQSNFDFSGFNFESDKPGLPFRDLFEELFRRKFGEENSMEMDQESETIYEDNSASHNEEDTKSQKPELKNKPLDGKY